MRSLEGCRTARGISRLGKGDILGPEKTYTGIEWRRDGAYGRKHSRKAKYGG